MRMKALLAAAAITAFTGSAIAQTTEPSWTAEEQAMYEEQGQVMQGFFVDETFAELRSPEEIETAWASLEAADQEMMLNNCADVTANPANYSQAMMDLCGAVGHY